MAETCREADERLVAKLYAPYRVCLAALIESNADCNQEKTFDMNVRKPQTRRAAPGLVDRVVR